MIILWASRVPRAVAGLAGRGELGHGGDDHDHYGPVLWSISSTIARIPGLACHANGAAPAADPGRGHGVRGMRARPLQPRASRRRRSTKRRQPSPRPHRHHRRDVDLALDRVAVPALACGLWQVGECPALRSVLPGDGLPPDARRHAKIEQLYGFGQTLGRWPVAASSPSSGLGSPWFFLAAPPAPGSMIRARPRPYPSPSATTTAA